VYDQNGNFPLQTVSRKHLKITLRFVVSLGQDHESYRRFKSDIGTIFPTACYSKHH